MKPRIGRCLTLVALAISATPQAARSGIIIQARPTLSQPRVREVAVMPGSAIKWRRSVSQTFIIRLFQITVNTCSDAGEGSRTSSLGRQSRCPDGSFPRQARRI